MTNDTNDTKDQDKRAPGMQRNILKSICYAATTRLYDTAAVFLMVTPQRFYKIIAGVNRRQSNSIPLLLPVLFGFHFQGDFRFNALVDPDGNFIRTEFFDRLG